MGAVNRVAFRALLMLAILRNSEYSCNDHHGHWHWHESSPLLRRSETGGGTNTVQLRMASCSKIITPLALLALVTVGLNLGDASPSGASGGKSPFVVWASEDLSGVGATYGKAAVLGAEVAAKQLNAQGGILGHPITVTSSNSEGEGPLAASEVEKELASQTPNLVLSGGGGDDTAAELPILMSHKILSYAGTSSDNLDNPSMYPYYFSINQKINPTVAALVDIAKQKHWTKVAMIYGNDAATIASEQATQAGFQAAGIPFVSTSYNDTSLNMAPQLEQLKSQNPSALIVSGYGTVAYYVMKSRAQIGWTSTPAYADFLGSFQPYPDFVSAADLKNFKVELQAPFVATDPLSNDPVEQKMITDAQSLKGGESVLTSTGASVISPAYSALEMVNLAAKQANSIDPTALKNALEHLKPVKAPVPWVWFGSSDQVGKFAYTPTQHYGVASPSAFIYVNPGLYNKKGLFQSTISG
jgi:branched-chain amino acid transport system substrate-binding protein